MVICGAGPNLNPELAGSKCQTGFPVPDRFDHAPIQVVDFSHLFAVLVIRGSFLSRRHCQSWVSIIFLLRQHGPYCPSHLVRQCDLYEPSVPRSARKHPVSAAG